MSLVDVPIRPELLEATDAEIEDAVTFADPMVLRGLLYQLTGDPEVAATKVKTVLAGFFEGAAPATDADVELLQRKAAELLKTYRDAGAGEMEVGPEDRLPQSLALAVGEVLKDEDMGLWLEDLALDPWARGLEWSETPDPKKLENFSVTIIGAGMGGLNAAAQLKRAGIPYTVIEKNAGVGGTWFENRYPGARVDSPSRSYTHIFGVDFGYPNPFCPWTENEKYFNWVADTFELRDGIAFNTEVRSMTWNENDAMWEIDIDGPEGERTVRSNAVITSVGFLNRPNIPEIEGMADFAGPSWHTARWPEDFDAKGKRIVVVGTGCTGYQTIPELALEAEHLTVFQRTPQWLFDVPGYRSPFPAQVNWLDRNMPYYTNFMRFRTSHGIGSFAELSEVDPEFQDEFTRSAGNRRVRDSCIAFLERKLGDPELVSKMTPPHPPFSARPVMIDPEYSVLDAIQRDNVTLITHGISRIDKTGVVDNDGVHHDADAIVYATGFHATEYLFPMEIVGRDGKTIEELWEDGGARAYVGCMMPGFPNLWSIYGPNTNGGLNVAGYHELVTLYAMQCMEKVILEEKESIEVTEDAYWDFARDVDERNARKVWSDPRAHNYYWTRHGRSAVMCPFTGPEVWRHLRHPNFGDLDLH